MSKKIHAIYWVIIILLLAGSGQVYYDYKYKPAKEREVKVFYNKDTQANRQVMDVIIDADKFVYFAIYTFTKPEIKDALLGAKHRGLEVRGVVDKKQYSEIKEQNKIVEELRGAGIPIVFQDHDAIMHLKTVVTDKAYVSGSYNWTASATERNDEVLEVGRDETIRRQYEAVLNKLFKKYAR